MFALVTIHVLVDSCCAFDVPILCAVAVELFPSVSTFSVCITVHLCMEFLYLFRSIWSVARYIVNLSSKSAPMQATSNNQGKVMYICAV